MVSVRKDQKNKKDPYQTKTVIWVTAQSIHSRSLEMNIETDMDPMSITRVTPPSYRNISQKIFDSILTENDHIIYLIFTRKI